MSLTLPRLELQTNFQSFHVTNELEENLTLPKYPKLFQHHQFSKGYAKIISRFNFFQEK